MLEQTEYIPRDPVAELVSLRQNLQRERIRISNRLSAVERGVDSADEETKAMWQRWFGTFERLEKEMDEDIRDRVQSYAIVDHMVQVKGCGYLLAAKIIAHIDIARAPHVASLWRYAGFGVNEEGAAERPVKGEKLHFNRDLKTACYLLATSFLKANSPYRRIYDSSKEVYAAQHADWSKDHVHKAALRKMTKVWIQHLWTTWRVLEGLDINLPYVHEKLGHTHIYRPTEFGWSTLPERDVIFDNLNHK